MYTSSSNSSTGRVFTKASLASINGNGYQSYHTGGGNQTVTLNMNAYNSVKYYPQQQQQQAQYDQRQMSINRHIPLIYAPETPSATLGPQRSSSAQNIYSDPRLAESERNLNYCIRFAVNGLSKTHMGSVPTINKNIQAGDFGDDAGMIAENSKCIVIGLADGAGGNRNIGIDPKKFSRSLLGYCVEIVKNNEVQPHQVAKLAAKSVHCLENRNIAGSGTLCLLSLNKETNIMTALNMGDSGFRLLRKGQIHHKSSATMAGSSPRQIYVSDSNFNGISFVDEQ